MIKNTGQLENLTDKQHEKLPFKNVYEKNGKAFFESEDENGNVKTIELGKCITCKKTVDIDSHISLIVLNNGRNEYNLLPSNLQPEKIMEIADYGFNVNYGNKGCYYCYISNLRFVAPTEYSHSKIGWKDIKGRSVYQADNIICKTKVVTSSYNGQFKIVRKGALNDWLKGIKEHVIGHMGLEIALLTAVCAVLNGYIGKDVGLQTFITHLHGSSSSGKTTAEKLAISFFSVPEFSESSLLNTFNGTFNSLINLIGSNYGMLIVLDDSSNMAIKDTTEFIYAATSNVDKRRLNASSQQNKPLTWQTVILTSGENPLVSSNSNKDGYKVRYIDVNLKFTESAEHAHKIENLIKENYGTALIPFVQEVMLIDKEKIISVFKKYHKRFIEKLDEGKYNDRLSKMYAMYVLSASLINKIFNIDINCKTLFDYFVNYHNEKKAFGDINERAYEFIKATIDKNIGKFIVTKEYLKNNTDSRYPNDCWGTVYKTNSYTEVAIFKDKCDELLIEGGFGNLREIYGYFKSKEYIDCDKETFTKRRVIMSAQHKCVVFILSDEDIPMFITYMNSSIKKRSVRSTLSNEIYNADEDLYLEKH